jgi:hypothetical protein
MPTKRFVTSAFLAGALLGLPLTAARADQPMTAPDAEAAAQNAREQADHFRQLGGVGYKAGLVRSSEAAAMRYDAIAEELSPTPAATREKEDVTQQQKLESHYQSMGGVSYKTGIEQRAEAQQLATEEAKGSVPMVEVQTPNPSCMPTKPAVDFACENAKK